MKVKPAPKRGRVVVELGTKDEPLLAKGAAKSSFRLKKILVPIDFSDCSKKALQYAVPFAKQFDASLILLYVVQVAAYYGGELGTIDLANLEEEMRVHGDKKFQELVASEIGQSVPCVTQVRTGRVMNEIVEAAKETETDLIIISTHGHTGLKHVLLGSVAENVVRHASCPVLIVRPHEHEFISK